MSLTGLLTSIDFEIATLQKVRALLAGQEVTSYALAAVQPVEERRTMSAEARAQIGAATMARGLLARWANRAGTD